MRRFRPLWGQESVMFAMLNRGKKSVAADLKDARVRDRMIALAKTADVVVEQFRPGVMDRLGLGYAALRAVNPRLIYCAITGYGQSGPRSIAPVTTSTISATPACWRCPRARRAIAPCRRR